MAEGYLAGILKGFHDYTSEERKRTREAEDAELARKQAILDDLYSGVIDGRIMPEHYAQILKDQMTLAGAKGGQRKSKGGVGGFFGATEGPMLSFVDAVLRGDIGGMEPDKAPAGLRSSFNSAIPSLNDAGVATASGGLMPPPPPPPSPFEGLQMSAGAPAESKPRFSAGPAGAAPFNSPRLTMDLPRARPTAEAMPEAPIPAPPQGAGPRPLFVNQRNRKIEDAMQMAEVQDLLSQQKRAQTRATLVANGATPEQLQEFDRMTAMLDAGLPADALTPDRVGEGNVIPDENSPTGFSQVLYDPRSGQERGRIPAPAPKAEGMPVSREDMLRDAEAALNITIPVEDYTKPNLGLTGAQLQAVEAWRKKYRGVNPQPIVIGASGLTPQQNNAAMALRRGLRAEPAYKAVSQAQESVLGALMALDASSGMGDILAINLLQRGIVDPGVAVREGDVAIIQKASPFFAKFFSTFPIDRLRTGDLLPPEARAEMRRLAKQIVDEKMKTFAEGAGAVYRRQAEAQGIPFDMVFEGSEHIKSRLGEGGEASAKEGVIDGVPVIWVEGKGWVVK